MCTHSVGGHGIGCQAVCNMVTNIQAREEKFHHLTYLKEARFARQLYTTHQLIAIYIYTLLLDYSHGCERRVLYQS